MAKSSEQEFEGFGPQTLTFLAQLSNNNRKDWFEQNRQRYEAEVREPARAFVRAMGTRLGKVSKQLVASDKKVGGSLMRVHRDVRFSKDKTPYKTNLGIQFRHARGKDVHAPGCYVHLGLDGCFLGMGMWRPDGPSLKAIRQSIDDNPTRWKRVLGDKKLNEVWTHGGDSLKRPPKGYDKEHPMLDVLKRKDHILVADLTVEQAESEELVDLAVSHFMRGKKHMSLLCEAIDVAF